MRKLYWILIQTAGISTSTMWQSFSIIPSSHAIFLGPLWQNFKSPSSSRDALVQCSKRHYTLVEYRPPCALNLFTERNRSPLPLCPSWQRHRTSAQWSTTTNKDETIIPSSTSNSTLHRNAQLMKSWIIVPCYTSAVVLPKPSISF